MEWLSNLLTIQGYNGGFSFFWTSPLGFITCLVIFLTSLYRVFLEKTDVISSLFEYSMAFVAAGAIIHIYEGSVPKHQMVTLVVLVAIKRLYNTFKHIKLGD